MTIIAALNWQGETVFGGNTGYTLAQDSVMSTGIAPWLTFQDWALGFTGSMLALNVCRTGLQNLQTKLDSEGDVANQIGKILTSHNIGNKPEGEATWSYGIWCILVHKSGQIWDLDESLCLGPIPKNTFWARGSGERYALGAARALMNLEQNVSCSDLVKGAIEAAIFNDLYCPGEVLVSDFN